MAQPKADDVRIYTDEHIAGAVVRGLRRLGIDVVTTIEAGLRTEDDPPHLAFALRERRLLFTQDEDFLILNAAGAQHYGIAYCPKDTQPVGNLVRWLVFICAASTADELRGILLYYFDV